jgi:hypothetical protein
MGNTKVIDLDTEEMLNRNGIAFTNLRALVAAMKAVERAERQIAPSAADVHKLHTGESR